MLHHRIPSPLSVARRSLSIPALLLLLLSTPLHGQGFDLEWMRLYGGHEEDGFTAVLPCDDGGYVAAGVTESYRAFFAQTKAAYVVRFGADGDRRWSRALSAFDIHTVDGFFPHPSGGWLLVGSVAAVKPATGFRLWIARLDTAGRLLSESRIDSVVGGYRPALTAAGNIVTVAMLKDSLRVSSVTPDGALNWTHRSARPPTASYSYFRGVVPLRTGGVVVMEEMFEGIPYASSGVGFHRFAENGERLRERYLDTMPNMSAVAQDSADDLIVLTTDPTTAPHHSFFRIDTNGILRSGPFVHDGLPSMTTQAMVVDSHGAVILTGWCVSAGIDKVSAIFIARIGSDLGHGSYRFFPEFNLGTLVPTGIAILDDGVVICGGTGFPTTSRNALLLRLGDPE